jgi:hypothetical protein
MEQAEKFELFDRSMWIDRLAPSFSSYSHSMTVKDRGKEKEKKEQHLSKEISNYQITTKAIDYSVKRCKHPQNDVIGA